MVQTTSNSHFLVLYYSSIQNKHKVKKMKKIYSALQFDSSPCLLSNPIFLSFAHYVEPYWFQSSSKNKFSFPWLLAIKNVHSTYTWKTHYNCLLVMTLFPPRFKYVLSPISIIVHGICSRYSINSCWMN